MLEKREHEQLYNSVPEATEGLDWWKGTTRLGIIEEGI
jgi:hypothetical protein